MFQAGLGSSVREWPHSGVKNIHTEFGCHEVEMWCSAGGAVTVEFEGLGAQCCTHLRNEFLGALCGQQATGVFEVDRVNVSAVRVCRGRCQELLIGVYGAGCVNHTGKHISDALLFCPASNLHGLLDVISRLGNHDAAEAMASHHTQRHPIHRLFSLLPRHEAHAGGDARQVSVGGSSTNATNALPRIFTVELGSHHQVSGAGEVQGVQTHALIDRCHGFGHAGGDASGSPEALVAVSNTGVNDLDGTLATLFASQTHLSHCSLPFVLPKSVQTSWWGLLRQ